MPEIREKMFFFDNGRGLRLLGFLHLPARSTGSVGILYCHPFAEEKNCSHAVTAKAARAFARQGFPVLRFDFSGCGDSEGELENATLDDWLEDIHSAAIQLKREARVDRIAVWGLRLGAGLALLEAAQRDDVAFAVLWHPVVAFKQYLHQFLRQRVGTGLLNEDKERNSVNTLTAQLQVGRPVEVFGYTITRDLYDSFISFDDRPLHADIHCPLFIASLSLSDQAPIAVSKIAEKLAAKTTQADFTHVQDEPFWDRYWCWQSPALTEKTVNWIDGWNQKH